MTLLLYASDVSFTDVSKLMEAVEAVDVLKQPDENASVIVSYNQGEPMLVTGESNSGWYRVTFQGEDGYVRGDSVKEAAQVVEEAVEALDAELDAIQQENKIIIEEVERVREEVKHSKNWTVVIAVLIVAIFAVGIYSTIRANCKDKEEIEQGKITTESSRDGMADIERPRKTSNMKVDLDIIDLDKIYIE